MYSDQLQPFYNCSLYVIYVIIVHKFDASLCVIIDMTREEGFNERASFSRLNGIFDV